MSHTVVAFGELLWDLLPDTSVLGGAAFNFANRIHSFSNTSIFVSALGNDTLGRSARIKVEELGLSTEFIQQNRFPTGTVPVTFDKTGKPDYTIIENVAYDYIESNQLLLSHVSKADCIYYGTLAQRHKKSYDTLRELLSAAHHAIKVYDVNLRKNCYTKDLIRTSLQAANILKVNDEEVFELIQLLSLSSSTIPEFCSEITELWDLDTCIVTLGPFGAYAFSGNETVYVPGYELEPIDTLGAGDAFTAGFIDATLKGGTLIQACEQGNLLGNVTATQKGATQPISRALMDEFVTTHTKRIIHEEFSSLTLS